MTNTERQLDCENVNGVLLSLKVDTRKGSPNSRQFTISYKGKQSTSAWPKISLLFAVLFNILGFSYVKINVTALLLIVIVLSFLIFFWVTHSVQSETVLVVPTVGIQSSVKYVCGREDNFVPWTNVDDVIINEVIKLNRVLYFLTVLVKGSQNSESNQDPEAVKLIPLFKYTKPRLVMLQKVYSELQILLTETQSQGDAKGSGDVG